MYLYLSGNDITSFSIADSGKLKRLDLGYNELSNGGSQSEPAVWMSGRNFPQLEDLWLSGNKLKTLKFNSGQVPKLKSLYLDNNKQHKFATNHAQAFLRGCLQSLKLVLTLMNEPQIVPQRPDRRTVGDPRPPTPTSQTRRPAPYSGPAGGSERHPVSASEWMPLADGPARSASLADPVQILPQLDHGWNVGTSQ